jgi:hypothetical protein
MDFATSPEPIRAARVPWHMKTPATILTLIIAASGAPWASKANDADPSGPATQRLIRAEVRVGNKVVLRGHTSDDGSPDADEVWSIAHTVKLYPTKEFATLKVPDDRDEFMVLGTPIPPDPVVDNEVHEHDAVFKISAGGQYETMALKIERVAPIFGKPWWRVPKDTIDARFNFRLVPRYLVQKLKKPRREK